MANEARQREEESQRPKNGEEHSPIYFEKKGEFWKFKYEDMYFDDYKQFQKTMETLVKR